ncbi:MAG: hypothetical protein R2831_05655 [Chitinophagaceae bacterium]
MKKIILILLALALVAGIVVYKFVFKASEDFAGQKPSASFTMQELLDKTSDTTSLNALKNTLISVRGTIKNFSKEKDALTIELGDTMEMNSIVCQVDQRHLSDLNTIQNNQEVDIKGLLTAYTIDDEMGLGNTIELKSCSLNK